MSTRKTAAMPAATTTGADLQSAVMQQIQTASAPTAQSLNLPNLIPVDETGLGDLPWFWQSGTSFNDATYAWWNNIFSYDSDGYVSTSGEALMSAYTNVLQSIEYAFDAADESAISQANSSAQATINTLISDWNNFAGPFPSTVGSTTEDELTYITTQILSWGNPGLTLSQLSTSTQPDKLLPNTPLGGSTVVSDLMTYLQKTSSISNIQNAAASMTAQLSATVTNSQPITPAVSPAPAGYMNTVAGLCVPYLNIVESTANIHNGLYPQSGGTSFSASFTASLQSNNQVQVTSSSGYAGVGDLLFFLTFVQGSSQYSLFSADSSVTTCTIDVTFNGVTTFTPQYSASAYNTATGTGWWNPAPIADAVTNTPSTPGDAPANSGYIFDPVPSQNFSVNGNFGVVGALLISQQPTISITYNTSNLSAFQQIFSGESSWGVSFLGVGLASGSSSYFSANAATSASGSGVTVTISPPSTSTPVATGQQLAYVIGASMIWPGATALQNQAGI